jgi:hypothetical protein
MIVQAKGMSIAMSSMTKIFFQLLNKVTLIRLNNRRIRSLRPMNYFALFFFVVSTLSASEKAPTVRHYQSSREIYTGPDRTITWGPWQQSPEGAFRFRTGDRYLGDSEWEHYLGFEQYPPSSKAIRLSMIRLGKANLEEDVVIRPGLRYAIVKVTNDTMTAHKGLWSWSAQEIP